MMTMQATQSSPIVTVQVIRAFTIAGDIQAVGAIVDMDENLARDLMNTNKVQAYTAPEPEPKPAARAKKDAP
jgi:hypothetical protein